MGWHYLCVWLGITPCAVQELNKAIDRAEAFVHWFSMCGRYRRTTSEDELARRYHIPVPPQRDLPISWNIAPTQDVLDGLGMPKDSR
jgi:hypothetical protein